MDNIITLRHNELFTGTGVVKPQIGREGDAMRNRDAQQMTQGLAAVVIVAVALLGLSVPVSAGSHDSPSGIRVISAAEVLRHHTETGPDGSLYFVDAIGARWALVTSISDPEIANAGDGSFHAMDEAIVLSVVGTIPNEFLAPLSVEIYLLPYPRAASLSSSFDGGAIYLSPGCLPYTPAQAAGLVCHELGHAVQRALMPDTDTARWAEYKLLRGIADSTLYRADAAHANRPHEIFAEDFRVLFGGALAAGSGSVENLAVGSPVSRPEVKAFFERLVGASTSPIAPAESPDLMMATWTASPNPSRAGQSVVLRPSVLVAAAYHGTPDGPVTIVVFDPSGREVSRQAVDTLLEPLQVPTRDPAGHELAAGAYWAQVVPVDGSTRPVTVPFRRTR
jgi:hypothetical protein